MIVLAIDTAGPVIGVALRTPSGTSVRTERVDRGSETRLAPWAQALAAEAGVRLGDIDGVALSIGPGAFTGLRVGLATGLGLAIAAGVPVWATDSLTPRAGRLGGDGVVMLDARKGRVYAARYAGGARVAEPADVPPEQALAGLTAPFRATGEGALVYRSLVEAAGGAVVAGADDPAVAVLAALGATALGRGEGRDPVAVRPLYLRDADATPPRAKEVP